MCKKKTHDEYVLELKNINPNIKAVDTYIDAKTKIIHKCMIDGCEWYASPNNILRGRGCPVCRGNYAVAGVTDIKTIRPDLMQEWNWEKNNKNLIDPSKLKENSNQKAWWICKYGHEWQAVISSRSNGIGCPVCAREKHSSDPEIKLYFYVKKYFADAISCYEDGQNELFELDVYVPSIHLGFEYDGERWHTNLSKDKKKDAVCHKLGINLIRFREPKCPKYESDYCTFVNLSDLKEETLENAIIHILKTFGIDDPSVCFERDLVEIESLIVDKRKEDSLAQKFPELSIQWHPVKNGTLNQYGISCHSGKKVWWLCPECGHEWKSRISSRSAGCGCPICAKTKTLQACFKPVYCPELNEAFKSMSDASKAIGIDIRRIYVCCNGIRKSAGKHPITGNKLHWYYINDRIKKDGSIVVGAISLGILSQESIADLLL